MATRLHTHFIPIWKEAPFLRLLVPLIPGIIFQWYVQLPVNLLAAISVTIIIVFGILYFTKYNATRWFGASLYALIFLLGCWLVILKDKRNWNDHISKHYYNGETVIAILQEPLVNKPNSYKAETSIQLIDSAGNIKNVKGNIIIYLQKDSVAPPLDYGSHIIFTRPLQLIKNSGNPGGFDYQRYSFFNNLYYQVFLKPSDYIIDGYRTINSFQQTLYHTRSWILSNFKRFIPGKVEAGLAEALLVGYKDDLDKSLVEQYANTGAVHIIAISGMHLALIYGLLIILLKPLGKKKFAVIVNAIIIISALWLFSILTGAAPSITRSASMFTVIVLANTLSKKTSIYNSLAISAFFLLIYNPFYLWDVGFQLSYAALLSIAVFGRPVTNWVYTPYKWLYHIWQLIAITIAAQIFTLPLVVYHFHQFPLYFLLSNLIAVPLSSIIMYVLLLLLLIGWLPVAANAIGFILKYLILAMNKYIGWVDSLPGSKIGEVYYTIPQAIALLLLIAALAWWLLRKSSNGFVTALGFLLALTGLKAFQHYQTSVQQKLIVYNIPQKLAVDIILGNTYQFIGDSILQEKGFLQNFHLLPSRILYQAAFKSNISLNDTAFTKITIGNKTLLIIDKPVDLRSSDTINTDFLLISKNIKTKPAELLHSIKCNTIILDASNSNWRRNQWKYAADSLHLRLHSVQDQGAFILDL